MLAGISAAWFMPVAWTPGLASNGVGEQPRTQAAAPEPGTDPARPDHADSREAEPGADSGLEPAGGQGPLQLDLAEQAMLRQLQSRDREVRAHEQAHIAAGGRYVRGGARFEYQEGPDGRQYAIGGEVSIDTSKESSPQATLIKAQAVRRAALAPAQPSAADRQVAAQASALEREARTEIARQEREMAQVAGALAGSGPDQPSPQAGRELFPPPQGQATAPPLAARMQPLSVYV